MSSLAIPSTLFNTLPTPLSLCVSQYHNCIDPDFAPSSQLAKSWLLYSNNPNAKWALGVEVYARLFSRHPEIVPLFRCADMDSLSKRLSDLLQIVAMSFGDMWTVRTNVCFVERYSCRLIENILCSVSCDPSA